MKKKNLLIGILVIVIIGLAAYYMFGYESAIDVDTTSVQRADLEKYVEDSGRVTLSEQQLIYASTSGIITNIYYDTGQVVPASAKVLEINSDDRRTMIHRRNTISEEIAIAERSLAENQRLLENKEILNQSGALSDQEYRNFYLMVQTEQSRIGILKREYQHIGRQISETHSRILSPINGILIEKHVTKGDFVAVGTPLLMIGDPVSKYIDSDILTSDISEIHEGDSVIIYNQDLGIERLDGVVTKIFPTAISTISELGVEQSRVKIKIEFKEDASVLAGVKPGFEFDLKIIVDEREDALYVPSNAIFKLNEEDHVFVVEDERSHLRAVEIGLESERNREILSGLSEGEVVIILPPSELTDGGRVQIQ